MFNYIVSEMSIPLQDFPKDRLHSKAQCKESRRAGSPKFCVIHKPSVHRLTGARQIVRSSTLIEDMCSHGVGHPNPDSAAYLNWSESMRKGRTVDHWFVHGCDGCCGSVPEPIEDFDYQVNG